MFVAIVYEKKLLHLLSKRCLKLGFSRYLVSGTVLSDMEFRDFLCTGYNVSPLNLQSNYNLCDTVFGVTHALICRTGSIVITCHNKICDGLLYLSQRAFTSSYVCAEPLIHKGCTRSKQTIFQGSYKDKETQGGCDDPRFMVWSSQCHHWRQTW